MRTKEQKKGIIIGARNVGYEINEMAPRKIKETKSFATLSSRINRFLNRHRDPQAVKGHQVTGHGEGQTKLHWCLGYRKYAIITRRRSTAGGELVAGAAREPMDGKRLPAATLLPGTSTPCLAHD